MYIQVRVYVKHDYDLIAMGHLPYLKLDDLIHMCVCAYVRKTDLVLPLPSEFSNTFYKDDIRICVTFDDEKDADVISWLKNVKYGLLNSVLKMITRSYIPKDIIEKTFLTDNENDKVELSGATKTRKENQNRAHKPEASIGMPFQPGVQEPAVSDLRPMQSTAGPVPYIPSRTTAAPEPNTPQFTPYYSSRTTAAPEAYASTPQSSPTVPPTFQLTEPESPPARSNMYQPNEPQYTQPPDPAPTDVMTTDPTEDSSGDVFDMFDAMID